MRVGDQGSGVGMRESSVTTPDFNASPSHLDPGLNFISSALLLESRPRSPPPDPSSDISERVLELDQLRRADQFGDAAIEVDGGLESLLTDLLVGDLVVPLVGVGPDLGEVEV